MLDQRPECEHYHDDKRNGEIWVHSEIRIENERKIHAYHEHLAMTEIDDLHYAEYDILPHSHQGIEASDKETVDAGL